MIDISVWLNEFMDALNSWFAERVWFVGLQGSYGRGEATEDSDIDVVVILDQLSAKDVQSYNTMLDVLPNREKVCGFLSGKEEIFNWEPSDLFQFYYDTKPLYGSLDALLPLIDEVAVDRAIKIGVCNVFHGCVHNMLHEKSEEVLKALYKSAAFVVYAIAFKQNGMYITCQKDLLGVLSPEDREILAYHFRLKHGEKMDFKYGSEILFDWSQKWIIKMKNSGEKG